MILFPFCLVCICLLCYILILVSVCTKFQFCFGNAFSCIVKHFLNVTRYFITSCFSGPICPCVCIFISDIESDAKFLLIVEKDAIFQKLLDSDFLKKFPPSILITVSQAKCVSGQISHRCILHELSKRAVGITLIYIANPTGNKIKVSHPMLKLHF